MDELRDWLLVGDPVIFDDMWAWLWEEEEEDDRKSLRKSPGNPRKIAGEIAIEIARKSLRESPGNRKPEPKQKRKGK